MAVLFATLGFEAPKVLAPLRKQTFASMHVFFGTPQETEGRAALAAVRITCKSLGVKLVEHGVKDAFDYTNFIRAFNEAHKQVTHQQSETLTFNVSGGTRPMTMAATIFCFTRDVPLVYFDEYQSQEGREIPLRAFRSLEYLGGQPRKILSILQRRGPTDMGSLASAVGVSPGTLTVHVQHMLAAGTILQSREGKRRIVRLAPDLAKVDLWSAEG